MPAPELCEHLSWTSDCPACDWRDRGELPPGCVGCNGEAWRTRGARLGFSYSGLVEVPEQWTEDEYNGVEVCADYGQRRGWKHDPRLTSSVRAYGIDSGSEVTAGAVEIRVPVCRSLVVQRFVGRQEMAEAIETMDFEVSSALDVRHPCALQAYEEPDCYPVDAAGKRLDVPDLGPAREWTLQKPVVVREGETTILHVTLRHAIRVTVTAVGPPVWDDGPRG